jgi:CheY-like chemotaxis protein
MAYSILLVEDKSEVREVIADLFEFEGFLVHQAADGAAALEVIDSRHIDLVLTDVHMPVLGGVALIMKIREKNKYLPLVFVLTAGAPDGEKEFLKLGVNAFFRKPVDWKRLLLAVKEALSSAD